LEMEGLGARRNGDGSFCAGASVSHAGFQTHRRMAPRTRSRDLDSQDRSWLQPGGFLAPSLAAHPSRGEHLGQHRRGCGASTRRDFAKFLDSSIKSANETEHHLLKAKALGLITPDVWNSHTNETIEVRKMTFGYRKKIIASDKEDEAKQSPRPSRRRKIKRDPNQ
jgi:hypothetical protein